MPLICRRGHVTRNEIGAIRVGPNESWFQIPRAIAPKFADTLKRTETSEDEQDAILIEESAEGPRIEARNNRKHGAPNVRAKPFRKGPGGKAPGGKGDGGKPRFKDKRDRKDTPRSGGEGRSDPFTGKPSSGKPKSGFKGKGAGKPKGKRAGPKQK